MKCGPRWGSDFVVVARLAVLLLGTLALTSQETTVS